MGDKAVLKEVVDLGSVPMAEVFEALLCDASGLSTKDAEQRLAIYGHNIVLKQFLGFMWNPYSFAMEVAAIMAIVLANGGGKPPDWQTFVGIIVMLLINSTISFIEESKASNASAALMAHLAPKTKVLRDGKWVVEDASILVPGDVISIKLGDIIPADARLLEGDDLKVDQSALTGEYSPVTKRSGSIVYFGAICTQGEMEAVVIATGDHTSFGNDAHLMDSMNHGVSCFKEELATIGAFCTLFIAVVVVLEIIIMYPIQQREYRAGIDNLLVLLIGGIPIAMPTVLSVTMAIGSHRLSQKGSFMKRMTTIEKMAAMDVLCIDKTGTLTLNKLSADRNLIEVFAENVEPDDVVLMAARASRVENQEAVDAAIVGMLADPKEARAGIQEVHFLPFNPTDKRTAITYIQGNEGKMHRVSKGAPEQILNLVHNKSEIEGRVHLAIDKYAERGLLSLAVAYQEVPEGKKESPGDPWQFIGLIHLFDPPRHDSAETIRWALDLGLDVKMITSDQLAIAKETGRRLGMGTNMYPASALLDYSIYALPVEELIEKADGFAGALPEHKYQIVKRSQNRRHICGMTGDGVHDALALMKADIGIAVADATETARTAVSITVLIVLSFPLIALIWQFDFPPFMILIIAILNDGTVMTMSKDRVKPSPQPDKWKSEEIFTTGIILGGYLATMTLIFFWAAYETDFFPRAFKVTSLHEKDVKDFRMLASAVYLQVSTISQTLIFVTRSRGWSYAELPGAFLMAAFVVTQMIATLIAVYADWGFACIKGIGWRWAGVIWLFNLVLYIPLDPLKLLIRYCLREKKTKGEELQLKWAHAQRVLHGLEPPETSFTAQNNYEKINLLAEDAV